MPWLRIPRKNIKLFAGQQAQSGFEDAFVPGLAAQHEISCARFGHGAGLSRVTVDASDMFSFTANPALRKAWSAPACWPRT